jgi:hypothetical protein
VFDLLALQAMKVTTKLMAVVMKRIKAMSVSLNMGVDSYNEFTRFIF